MDRFSYHPLITKQLMKIFYIYFGLYFKHINVAVVSFSETGNYLNLLCYSIEIIKRYFVKMQRNFLSSKVPVEFVISCNFLAGLSKGSVVI